MNTFWVSLGTVLLVELTDRTRIIALLLSSRFKAPLALILGMTAGYLIPLALAAYGADFITQVIPSAIQRVIIASSFLGFGVWLLVHREDETGEHGLGGHWQRLEKWGPLVLGFVLVFVMEFADKSQIATAVLATRLRPVTGVYLGALAAQALLNILYVYLGQWLGRKVPERLIRRIAAWAFIGIGLVACFA